MEGLFEPVAMAGYSVYIYQLSLDDVNQVRRNLGLPELSLQGKNVVE